MTDRLDDLVGVLVDAVVAETLPLRGDGPEGLRERLRPAIAEALRSAVRPSVAPDRLDKTTLARDAAEAVARAGDPTAVVALVATLLGAVREADQREEWIRAGYSADSRRAWAMYEDAAREASALRHAVRLTKRAVRGIVVGRE